MTVNAAKVAMGELVLAKIANAAIAARRFPAVARTTANAVKVVRAELVPARIANVAVAAKNSKTEQSCKS